MDELLGCQRLRSDRRGLLAYTARRDPPDVAEPMELPESSLLRPQVLHLSSSCACGNVRAACRFESEAMLRQFYALGYINRHRRGHRGSYLVHSRLRLRRQRQEDAAYLIFQFIAIQGSSFVLLVKFLGTVKYTQLPFPNMDLGRIHTHTHTCMPVESNSNLLGGVFSMFLGSVIIVMGMMIYFVFTKHRNFNGALLTIFYRDGIFYFLAITVLASANIIVNFAAPTGYKFLFIQTEADIHTILATRMLLHLRAWAEREQVQVSGRSDGRARGIGMGFSTTIHSRRVPSPMKFEERRIAAPMDSFGTTETKISEGYPMLSTPSTRKDSEFCGRAV